VIGITADPFSPESEPIFECHLLDTSSLPHDVLDVAPPQLHFPFVPNEKPRSTWEERGSGCTMMTRSSETMVQHKFSTESRRAAMAAKPQVSPIVKVQK
jgi:hypothetical protein